MFTWIENYLTGKGLSEISTFYLTYSILLAVLAILCFLSHWMARKILLRGILKLVQKTKNQWDDVFLEKKVFNRLAHIAPAIVIYFWGLTLFPKESIFSILLKNIAHIYAVLMVLIVFDAVLNSILEIYRKYDISKRVPLKGLFQILKIGTFFCGVIIILSILANRSPLYFLGGLGALTAVLLLIFKDAILGLVAGVQLTANKMVQVGDWIEMSNHNADGDVLDVSLTTVKVQNWDKTITTIPTYTLISESFKNWRGMSESGGRRIKRSIFIDMNTVKFCDAKMLEHLKKIQLLKPYINQRIEEIETFNTTTKADPTNQLNGRRLTNIGIFRAYVAAYLKNHPKIHGKMTFLIRHLAPSEKGLPLEIYVFTNDIAWGNYESIQADIFDHILASISEFDLSVFQNPSGEDFSRISGNSENT